MSCVLPQSLAASGPLEGPLWFLDVISTGGFQIIDETPQKPLPSLESGVSHNVKLNFAGTD